MTQAKRATTPLGKRNEKFEVGLGRRIVFANGASSVNNAFAPRKSKVRFASHTTSRITELESVQSSVDILLQHKLPKARQRTNVVTQNYTPRGRSLAAATQQEVRE